MASSISHGRFKQSITTGMAAALCLLLASCSSNKANQDPDTTVPAAADATLPASSAPVTTDPPASTAAPEPDNSPKYIATVKLTGDGDRVTTRFTFGPPTTAAQEAPPDEVLDACNINFADKKAKSIYIHGQIDVTYQGSIAQVVSFPTPEVDLLTDAPGFGTARGTTAIATPDGTGWKGCGELGTDYGWLYTLDPGTHLSLDAWIAVGGILSNAHPTLTSSDRKAIALTWAATASDQTLGGKSTRTQTGPGAANCVRLGDEFAKPDPTVLLYAKPPMTYTALDPSGGYKIRCR